MVVLDPMKAGGPFEVMAQQTLEKINFTLRVHDVLFGDVWLCSGQSNMQMTVLQVIWRVSAIIHSVGDEEGKEGGIRGQQGETGLFLFSEYHEPRSVLSALNEFINLT